jgi:hypothetical protein
LSTTDTSTTTIVGLRGRFLHNRATDAGAVIIGDSGTVLASDDGGSSERVATAVHVESARACAIVAGSVYCWNTKNGPAKVAGLPTGVGTVKVGYNDTCVLALGEAYCWGRNNLGQLGDGTQVDSTAPVKVRVATIFPGDATAWPVRWECRGLAWSPVDTAD